MSKDYLLFNPQSKKLNLMSKIWFNMIKAIFQYFLVLGYLSNFINAMNEDKINKFDAFKEHSNDTYLEIKSSFEKIKRFVETNSISTTKYFKKKEFLSFSSELNKSDNNEILCESCLKLISSIRESLFKHGDHFSKEFFYLLCPLFPSNKEDCYFFFNLTEPIISSSLLERYLNSEIVCSLTSMCKNKYFVELSADDYARKILSDKPNDVHHSSINTKAEIWKVLHVSDMHVDYNYKIGSKGICPDEICCHDIFSNDSYVGELDNNLVGKYGYIGRCDIPLATLENFAEKVFNDIKPDFIIWTGDNAVHQFNDLSDKSHFKTAEIFTNIIKVKYNYTLPVYPSIGNHDLNPLNLYDINNPNLYKESLVYYGDLYRDWIGEEGYQSYLKFGAYTKLHPGSNLRIISTNCFLCYAVNFFLIRNPTDPQLQIKWLENTLREAEKNGELVYLISHIPFGDVNMLSECSKRFKILIERFSHIIRGQFFGHTHLDEVKIYTNYFNKTQVSSVGYVTSSLTTYYKYLKFSYHSLLPSFRIFEIDSDTKLIRDYIQYQLNVTKANHEDYPEWEIFYKASELYNVTYLNETQKIYEMTQKIFDDHQIYEKFLRVFFTNGPRFDQNLAIKKMQLFLGCRFNFDVLHDIWECAGSSSWDFEDNIHAFMDIVIGPWWEIKPR